jgi:hypothetical protein
MFYWLSIAEQRVIYIEQYIAAVKSFLAGVRGIGL